MLTVLMALTALLLTAQAQTVEGRWEAEARDWNGIAKVQLQLRIHGATPEFMDAMANAGYDSLSPRDLIQFRIHGVSADFARGMRELGYALSARDLQQARIHGVSAEFARDVARAGLEGLAFRDWCSSGSMA